MGKVSSTPGVSDGPDLTKVTEGVPSGLPVTGTMGKEAEGTLNVEGLLEGKELTLSVEEADERTEGEPEGNG